MWIYFAPVPAGNVLLSQGCTIAIWQKTGQGYITHQNSPTVLNASN